MQTRKLLVLGLVGCATVACSGEDGGTDERSAAGPGGTGTALQTGGTAGDSGASGSAGFGGASGSAGFGGASGSAGFGGASGSAGFGGASGSTGSGGASSTGGVKWHPGHYLQFGRYKEGEFKSRMAIAQSSTHITGLGFTVNWKQIEVSKGVYDFSDVDKVLNIAKQHKMRLILLLGDRTFNPKFHALPQYLSDAGGEVALQNGTKIKGWAPKLWEAWVVDRYIALLGAIGKRYDNDPYFEAVRGGETTMKRPSGTDKVYTDQLARIVTEARKVMPHTLYITTMNWIGGGETKYLFQIAEEASKVGGALGHPDTTQHLLKIPGYEAKRKYVGKVAIMPQANVSDLKTVDTAESIYNIAINDLKSSHLAWSTTWGFTNKYGVNVSGDVWLKDHILPVLKKHKGFVHKACPSSFKCASTP